MGVLIDQKVELWDWEKSTRIDTIDSSNIGLILKMRDFAFIPGKDELIIGPSSKSLDYGAVLYSFSGSENANIPTGKLLAMLYETSPDGKYLLTGDFDDELKNTLTLWNYDSKEPEHHWILNGFPTNLTFSNDSKYFASAAFDTLVYLWGADSDDTTIKILSGHTEGTTAFLSRRMDQLWHLHHMMDLLSYGRLNNLIILNMDSGILKTRCSLFNCTAFLLFRGCFNPEKTRAGNLT